MVLMTDTRHHLRKAWMDILKSGIARDERLGILLSRVLLERSHTHLYRGTALRDRAKALQEAYTRWVASHRPEERPDEDASLDWLAARFAEIEKEVPNGRV